MTISTFPNSLPGLSFPVKKTPTFQSIVHTSVSGVSTGQSTQPFASYAYELPFEFLRSDAATLEQQQLMSFYQACRGMALPFHFLDPDDNSVAGQVLGIGDGVTTQFALIRTMNFVADPIQDADTGSIVAKVNGTITSITELTTSQYGTVYGVQFAAAPAAAAVVSASFTYKFLSRFTDDKLDFQKSLYINGKGVWAATVKFGSVLQ